MYDVRASQEAQVSTVCYGDSFTLLICMMLVPHRKHKPLLSFTGTSRRRWINNIEMDLLEIGVGVVHWIGLAQDIYSWRALVNAVMNLRAP
jgi:hypothetical protein